MIRPPAILWVLAVLEGCTGSIKDPPAAGGAGGAPCTAPFLVPAPDSGPIDLSMEAGTCGDACAGTCLASGCLETLATAMDYAPNLVAVDSTNVYWAAGGIWSAPHDGGAPISLAPANATDIVVAPPDVYWTNSGSGPLLGSVADALEKVPIGGGPATRLASSSDQFLFQGLAVDATYVYWTERSLRWPSDGGLDRGGDVLRVPRSGGATVTLASVQGEPTEIAVDATSVYWTNTTAGTVMKMPLAGGPPVTLAAGQDVPAHIAVDATSVYWTNLADGADAGNWGSVVTVPVCGGTAHTLASNRAEPYAIAIDESNVYWTEIAGAGGIFAVPRAGGASTRLVSAECGFVAAAGKSIYWSQVPDSPDASGMVRKLTLR